MDKGLLAILIPRPRPGAGYIAWVGTIPLDEEWGSDEVEFGDQPSAEVRAVESESGGVHLTGKVSATFLVRCRRCLVRQSGAMESAIDIRFEPDIDSWDEAPGLYALDNRLEELDLLPALREELLLALPSYPVCRPDCRGLCAVCGTDLNEGTCNCLRVDKDPRWEALRKNTEDDSKADDGDDTQEG